MKTSYMIAIVLFAAGLLFAVVLGGWAISVNNTEVDLRTQVEAVQKDNTQQLANMRNKFKETASVTNKEAELLTSVFVKYAEARSGQGGGSFATAVREAVPTINPQTLVNLQNILESGRNSWTSRQTVLVDKQREHKNIIRKFPGNVLFSILGRKEIEITIVTSADSEEAFRTGKEESVNLFGK